MHYPSQKSLAEYEKLFNVPIIKEIRNHAPSNAVLMLVGNKADLEDQRKVDFDRAEQLASRLGVSLYEVSHLFL